MKYKQTIFLFILSLFFFSTNITLGQENFLPGYIIKNHNDTIHGFVDYRNWEKNPDHIFFKTKNSGSKITYTTKDIKEFGVKDEIYVSAKVKIETSTSKTNNLEYSSKLNIKTDSAFLQTLFNGAKSLYYYKTKDSKDNFYIFQDNKYELLIQKKYLKHTNGSNILMENSKFRGQLSFYLSDCSQIKKELETVEYKKTALTELFQHYYQCTNSNFNFKKNTEKTNFEFGAVAGISISNLDFRGQYHPELEKANFTSSLNPSGGLFFNAVLGRNQRKWSFYNELMLSTYDITATSIYTVNENNYTTNNLQFEYTYIKLNNMVRYKYPVGKFFMFLAAGISNGIAINGKNHKKETHYFYSSEKTTEGNALDEIRKHEESFNLGIGTIFNKIIIEARYEGGTGLSKYSHLKSKTKRWFFLLGYRF